MNKQEANCRIAVFITAIDDMMTISDKLKEVDRQSYLSLLQTIEDLIERKNKITVSANAFCK
jgi:hypothetical protein